MLVALVMPAFAGLVINEVQYNPSGSDDGLEWLEICADADVDLTGYTIEVATSGTWSEAYTFASGSAAAGDHVLVGAGSASFAGSFSPNLGNVSSDTDGVRLKDATGTVVDTVLYGSPNDDGLTDDAGAIDKLAPECHEGESIGRWPDCGDTNDASADFVVYASPSPGAANAEPSSGGDTGGGDTGGGDVDVADCSNSDGVVINELVYTTGAEYVELYNGGSGPVHLGGWKLEFGTSSYNKDVTVGDVVLAPGEWYVVGAEGATCADQVESIDLGNASNTDGLRLTCNDTAVDTVLYGDPNDDGWTDDGGQVATSFADADLDDGQSISRTSDGYDTDQSGLDFSVTAQSCGGANPVIVCETDGGGSIKLNEFLYDPDGSDSGLEWVEIYNAGDVAYRLDGWVIETATSSWGVDAELPAGTELAPGDYLVIGGEGAPEVDIVASGLSLGNGTDGDGLRLSDCRGAVVDTVLYGDEMADGLVGDGGSTAVVPGVDSDVTLARVPDGHDSDSIDDWFPCAEQTPGEANCDPAATGDDTGADSPQPGGCNCGGDRPGGTRPTAAFLPFGALSTMGWLLRRKRR